MRMKDKYAIAGIGMTAQGAVPGRTSLSFHLEACANAIKDAGVPKDEIDGLICYRQFPPASNEGPLHALWCGSAPGHISNLYEHGCKLIEESPTARSWRARIRPLQACVDLLWAQRLFQRQHASRAP